MNSNQKGAVYSFAYNLGAYFYGHKDFKSITQLLSNFNLWGETQLILDTFTKYRNPGSAAEIGLKRRRIAEAKLFLKP